jgi:hypothetical protein
MRMGDWVWGQASPNGKYFAASVGNDNSGSTEIRLIDVEGWTELGSWQETSSSELFVSDEGIVYFFSPNNQLRSLTPGDESSVTLAEVPLDYYVWGGQLSGDGLLASYGVHTLNGIEESSAIVVTVIDTGALTVIDLPQARHGSLEPTSNEPWSGYLYAFPGFVLDPAGSRALVVHAHQDVVSEVDLLTGSVTDHEVPELSAVTDLARTSLQRSAALSPDGGMLFVASTRTEALVDGHDWTVTNTPLGVRAIDTTSWTTSFSLDEPIGEIRISPEGDRLLATGFTSTESQNLYEGTTSGLFLLEAAQLRVLAHHEPPSADTGLGGFSFNQEAGVGYTSIWNPMPSVLAIDLHSGQITAEATGSSHLEMLGPIGVMSELR